MGTKVPWVDQLTQIPGVSVGVARGVAESYPTAGKLLAVYYSDLPEQAKASLLENVERNDTKKRVGESLSRKIYEIMTGKDPNILLQNL
jgi:hypothetical protein